MTEKLAEELEIEHVEIIPPNKSPVVMNNEKQEEQSDDVKEDYQLSRKTLRKLIEKGEEALDGISDLARHDTAPRAYEVYATVLKTVADLTKDLFALQKQNKDMKETVSEKVDQQSINVDKAVFVGTTHELIKKIKNEKEKEK